MMYDGMSDNVTDVGFNDDVNWIYTCGEDGTARIWDLRCKINDNLWYLYIIYGGNNIVDLMNWFPNSGGPYFYLLNLAPEI